MTTFHGPPAEAEEGIGALTLGTLFDEFVTKFRDREAIAFCPPEQPPIRWSYDDLDRNARAIARALIAAGVGKSSRVGLLMPNRPEWVAATFGIALAGGVVVPMSTWATADELDHLLRHSDIGVLLTQGDFMSRADVLSSLPPTRYPYLRQIVDLSTESWQRFLDGGTDVSDAMLDAVSAQVAPADDAIIIYTSGTTALPKGMLHAHRAPALQIWRFASRQRLTPDDRVYSAFPFFWTAGFAMVMGATLAAGSSLVVQETFDPGEALRLIEEERVTCVHAWPHQAGQIRDHPASRTRDLSSLRFDQGRLRPDANDDSDLLGTSQAGYGMSETFTIVTSAPVDAPRDIIEGSHGPILAGNALRIIDQETRELLSVGQEGEILVKGRTLMKGYLKLPPEACFDEDGFFHSGDTGYVDERGLLHWTGRASDLIKTGGANVSPVELETVLAHHPGLAGAAAVGVPDALLGEIVVVCAVPRAEVPVDEEDVQEFVRRRLSAYKVPRRVLFFDETELPLTGNEKIQLAQLRKAAAERLGL